MTLLIAVVILAVAFAIYQYFYSDKLEDYKNEFKLQKSAIIHSQDYGELVSMILPARSSSFSKRENTSWSYFTDKKELFLVANRHKDLRMWLQPELAVTDIHLVLDSTANDGRVQTNLISSKLPAMAIELEGDFQKYFQLYCKPGQQILALQIFSPDLMAYVVDKAMLVDVEIVDGQIAIIVKRGAKNSDSLQNAITFATNIDKLIRSVSKVTKK